MLFCECVVLCWSINLLFCFFFFFFNDTATTEIYTLSLHDALPISPDWTGATTWCATPPSSGRDRKSTRLNSSHVEISYAVFCLKKKKTKLQVLQMKSMKTTRSVRISSHT